MGFFNQQQSQDQQGRTMDRAQFQAKVQRDFDAIRSNTGQFIDAAGVNVPENIRNDPRAMCMHLMQTGQVPQGRMRAAQPLINMLMGGRR